MKTFFLSASVPLRARHEAYYQTADVVAIRESLRGLVAAVLPTSRLVFGGHPAITPMVRVGAQRMGLNVSNSVTLYQSAWFCEDFPQDNEAFEKLIVTERLQSRETSLSYMRHRMLTDQDYDAAVFIGGMNGIEEEWKLFGQHHPGVPRYPIASTGAAARILFEKNTGLPEELATEFAYLHLFRKHLLNERG